jgi:hypothetical protein
MTACYRQSTFESPGFSTAGAAGSNRFLVVAAASQERAVRFTGNVHTTNLYPLVAALFPGCGNRPAALKF